MMIRCLGILLILLLFSCSKKEEGLPFYNTPAFTPEWISKSETAYQNIHTIAPFSFTNQEGQTVTQSDFDNHIYVAKFFFTTCPGMCPRLTENMSILQEEFEKDEEVLFLSHSVTPKRDSVPKLKAYAEHHGVLSHKWHLVTGVQEDIYELARQSYYAEMEESLESEKDDFLHTENFLLIDKKRRIRGIYNGLIELEMKRIIEDVNTLKKETM